MTNEEYVRQIGRLYNEVMRLRKDDDYVVNQPQMDKLIDILKFFIEKSTELNGEVEPTVLTPREEHGGVTAKFVVFDVCGEDVQRFCNVIQYASAMSIDAESDCKICISITVPKVFVPKTK